MLGGRPDRKGRHGVAELAVSNDGRPRPRCKILARRVGLSVRPTRACPARVAPSHRTKLLRLSPNGDRSPVGRSARDAGVFPNTLVRHCVSAAIFGAPKTAKFGIKRFECPNDGIRRERFIRCSVVFGLEWVPWKETNHKKARIRTMERHDPWTGKAKSHGSS